MCCRSVGRCGASEAMRAALGAQRVCGLRGLERILSSWLASSSLQAAQHGRWSEPALLLLWPEPALWIVFGRWSAQMNRAKRGDFFFQCTGVHYAGWQGINCGHKKALQGVNLAGLVGVAGGLDAVVLLDCCTEDFGMVGFQACYKVSHCLSCCGFICSKL